MIIRISATEATRAFSDVVSRVKYRGEAFLVEKGGEPVCRIEPVGPRGCTGAELLHLFGEMPSPDPEYVALTKDMVRKQPKVPRKSPWER